MSEILCDRVVVHGTPAQVWSLIEDAAALQRVLPGAESIVATGPGTFRGVLASRIQFLTVRADVEATFHEPEPPRHVRLVIEGRPRGLAGSFLASIPFDLEPAEPAPDVPHGQPRTSVAYAVDLQVSGRLATFGLPLLRDTFRRQVTQLVANVDRELAPPTAAPTDAGGR